MAKQSAAYTMGYNNYHQDEDVCPFCEETQYTQAIDWENGYQAARQEYLASINYSVKTDIL